MFYKLGEDVVSVSMFGKDMGNISTIVFLNQTDMQHILSLIGSEMKLYEDYELTKLAAVFNQVEVQKASVDLVGHSVSVTISASRLSELETEQMKTDIATEQTIGQERDEALMELGGMVNDLMEAVAELGQVVEQLKEEIEK